MDPARARKLGGRIAQIVAEMLERRIKDPRLGFVTVTEARLTNDLREATVFYTVYGSAEERAGTAAALASAVGVIRSEVGRQTGLRHTPSLEFKPDTLPDNARNIEELVARAREADAAVAAVRVGAEPAGEADPYRVPADPADDSDGRRSRRRGFLGRGFLGRGLLGRRSGGDDPRARTWRTGAPRADDLAGGRPAGQSGQSEHLAETPASGERGAGYSRS